GRGPWTSTAGCAVSGWPDWTGGEEPHDITANRAHPGPRAPDVPRAARARGQRLRAVVGIPRRAEEALRVEPEDEDPRRQGDGDPRLSEDHEGRLHGRRPERRRRDAQGRQDRWLLPFARRVVRVPGGRAVVRLCALLHEPAGDRSVEHHPRLG